MAVDQDLTSLVYLPSSTAQWSELLTGLGISAPSSFWLASQASGSSLADLGTGGRTATISGSPTLGASAAGWSATGIQFTDAGSQRITATIPDVSATSGMMLQIFTVNSAPAATRTIGTVGDNSLSAAKLLTTQRIEGVSGANTTDGVVTYPNTVVLITKADRAHSTFGVYARGEQLKPTWFNPAASTTLCIAGYSSGFTAPPITLLYAAYWSGADAEISDALIQDLIDAVYGDSTTLSKMQAGSFNAKVVVLIEGCKYALSDAPQAAVQSALAGTDWASATVLPVFVDLKNSQSVTPWQPFTGGGSCRVIVPPDSADTFGIWVNRRSAGAETELTATIDRNDTTITVAGTTDFTASGDVYIGTECVGYTGKGATSFTGATRGKYSPFGCASSGSGGLRFGNHHRKGQDPNHVLLKPVVTQLPRVWIGKRVGVWLHTWDAANSTLNSRDEAQLLYAGRIAEIADDPNTFATVLDIEPIHEEIKNGVIGKDMWTGELSPGIDVKTGRTFSFLDWKAGSAIKTANVLTVKASGASGTNEINAGRYSLSELSQKLSEWLGGELKASRIYGSYSVASPISANSLGLRTKIYWRVADASTIKCGFGFTMPGEIAVFFGFTDAEPGSTGQSVTVAYEKNTNQDHPIAQGVAVPFTTLIFKPDSPSKIAQEFSESPTYNVENEKGTFIDQYAMLPANIKSGCNASYQWGLFLLNETSLVVGSYASNVLTGCWLAPFQLTADNSKEAIGYIGTRADEPEAGPATVRQIFVLEDTLATLLSVFLYGSGTSGYNHGTYDTLGYGLGIGIPGELLGGSFENSLSSLPGSGAPIAIVIDEPTKLVDLFSADLVLRRAFLRWKDEAFEFAQWQTPKTSLSIASLTESTKAAPAGQVENHRIASLESTEHARPIVKLDYARDFAVSRDGQYLKSFQIEDQTAVDDAGGNVAPFTLKLRNTYHDLANTGSAIDALLPQFLSFMPVLARPFRMITRSIDMRYFEGYSVGDIVTVTDSFARDPLTGARGITARAGMISRISYDLGGPSPDGSVRPMGGEVDIMFLDVHRGELYAPSAQVDDTATNAGYNAGTGALTCYTHKYSNNLAITVNFGRGLHTTYIEESPDASNFTAGDKILICEIDPANPASPDYWERTIATVSGNVITPTATLSAPAWSATKKYRITFQKYSQCTATQQDAASFEADNADMEVGANLTTFYHYSHTEESGDYDPNVDSTGLAAYIPTISYGDERAHDVGNDRQLCYSLDQYIDRKSNHQAPMLWSEYTISAGTTEYSVAFMGPVAFGTEHLNSSVTRTASVAPWMKSNTGGVTGYVRVTLSDTPPVSASSAAGDTLVTSARFTGRYAQAEFTTTSTTWAVPTAQALSLDTKNLQFGIAYVTIEVKGCTTRGLSKFIEGPRTVS